ncbi:unnamed protein product [Malus baccata var. baccata]
MVSVAEPPKWLDGSLPGDRGFDPFGLGKPAEYLQFDYDRLDQNLAKNVAGDIIGTRIETAEAMLGALGALVVEGLTGVAWQDSGKSADRVVVVLMEPPITMLFEEANLQMRRMKRMPKTRLEVELIEGSSYLDLPLPFSITTLIWIEVLVIDYIEFQRNAELDPEKRLYPGGGKFFDPLGLAADPDEFERLQLAEIKHARLPPFWNPNCCHSKGSYQFSAYI